jgi:hypothetical protein
MAVEFFNFGNDETYHFFRWVTDGGRINPDELIAEALEQVEGDELYKMGMDVSSVAKDNLAAILKERLEDLGDATAFTRMSNEIGEVDGNPESLFEPLLKLAIDRIDLHAAAEAMFIRAGKWAPDRERPDIK